MMRVITGLSIVEVIEGPPCQHPVGQATCRELNRYEIITPDGRILRIVSTEEVSKFGGTHHATIRDDDHLMLEHQKLIGKCIWMDHMCMERDKVIKSQDYHIEQSINKARNANFLTRLKYLLFKRLPWDHE